MCFPSGPSGEEKQAAADQRVAAEQAKREEIEKRAESKREDISEALSARTQQRGMRGGRGRRSLFRSGGAGFLGRFNS
jgi:hypothetical protein